jgi:hypothetical protein
MPGQTRVNAGQSLVPGHLSLDVARQSTLINSLLPQTLAVSGVANSTIIGGVGAIFINSCSLTLKTIDFKIN